ncbi:MAG TPA: sigma-70 family RNA polymerase sigma factor [Polyangiaceae bacterium]
MGGQTTHAEVLYARLSPVVNRLIWTFLGPDSECDDIAHDIFVKILRSASSVKQSDRLEDWAARVTMNTIKNEFRRRKLRRFVSLHATTESNTPRCHVDFEGRELLMRTQALLERLPTTERIPLTLQLLRQASVAEIAHLCGYSTRTAKRRLKSAKARFLKLAQSEPTILARLAPWGEEPSD